MIDRRWNRSLVVSDIHGCHVEKRAWKVFLDVCSDGCEGRPWDAVYLNGDTCDMSQLAKFDKKGGGMISKNNEDDDITLEEEIFYIKTSIFTPLRKALGEKTKIVFRLGNHDFRFKTVSETKPEALMTLLKTMRKHKSLYLEDILELDAYGIEYDDKDMRTLFDCYTITHGWKTNKTCAEWYLTRLGSGTSGHTHKATVAARVMKGRSEFWHESGCMCKIMNVPYLPYGTLPEWTQGFVSVVIDTESKRPFPQFHLIDDQFKCRFNNIVYEGR